MSEILPRDTTTPNLGLNKPDVGGDDDQWGDLLNANADIIDGVVNQGGATSGRPTSPQPFQQYFDTTLNYPVWWNGSAWINAVGAVA